jgi:hypothetical protein
MMTNETIKLQLYRWLPWLIIAFGFGLRLDQYLFNRSLWLDEAFFAVNFYKDLPELLSLPQDYSHSHIAPPGFLVITHFFISLFGNHDWVLRLFPFIMGSVGLVIFHFMAKHYVSPLAGLMALFFFAVADSLIDYTTDFKQYASDVTITIALLWLAASWRAHFLTDQRLIILAFIGILTPWFSHPGIFILAGVGSYLFLLTLVRRHWQQLLVLSLIICIWILNFTAMYIYISNGGIAASPIGQWLLEFWRNALHGFMPSPLTEAGFSWLIKTYIKMFHYPAGLGTNQFTYYLPAILFALGCLALLPQRRYALYLFLVPILIALVASHWEKYPFFGRMILFLLPIFYLVIAEAIAELTVYLQSYQWQIFTWSTRLVLFLALLNWPFSLVFERQQTQEMKPILAYLQTHRQPEEKIYLYHWAEPAFRYYAPFYGFDYKNCHLINPIPKLHFTKEIDYFRRKQGMQPVAVNQTDCVLGVAETFAEAKADLDKLLGTGRVWFISTHLVGLEKQRFFHYLNQQGKLLDEKVAVGAFAYLYDLN